MINEIVELATKYHQENLDWRWGQSLFNAAHTLYPKQANLVRATPNDPFFAEDKKDEQVFNFMTFLAKQEEILNVAEAYIGKSYFPEQPRLVKEIDELFLSLMCDILSVDTSDEVSNVLSLTAIQQLISAKMHLIKLITYKK
jgi:hypothetical protein